MIIHLPQGARKLALKIANNKDHGTLATWKGIQLHIAPGAQCDCGCWEGGSPWVLNGCWPGKITGVDIANPWRGPDIPTLVYDAQTVDEDGRIVFFLDDKLEAIPPGRYRGYVQYTPIEGFVFDPAALKIEPKPEPIQLPPGYESRECSPDFPSPPPPVPPKRACILAEFEIDLGVTCGDHHIDHVMFEETMKSCAENCNGES